MERKIILNLAISLDGFIADEEGGFSWIVGDNDVSLDTDKKFDFEEFAKEVDVIVMGRKAYEDCPSETLDSFSDKKIYVATHKNIESKSEHVEVIGGDVVQTIMDLKNQKGKNIWLFGGAGVLDPFLKADVIDEYIIGVIPTILGKGRPLFLKENPTIKLHLEAFTSQEGIVVLKYSKRK